MAGTADFLVLSVAHQTRHGPSVARRSQDIKRSHHYRGGLGDGVVKKRLETVLQDLIRPIRERRAELEKDKGYVLQVLKQGTEKAREVAAKTTAEVKAALGLSHF